MALHDAAQTGQQDFINRASCPNCEPVVKSYILIMLGKCWSLIPVKLL